MPFKRSGRFKSMAILLLIDKLQNRSEAKKEDDGTVDEEYHDWRSHVVEADQRPNHHEGQKMHSSHVHKPRLANNECDELKGEVVAVEMSWADLAVLDGAFLSGLVVEDGSLFRDTNVDATILGRLESDRGDDVDEEHNDNAHAFVCTSQRHELPVELELFEFVLVDGCGRVAEGVGRIHRSDDDGCSGGGGGAFTTTTTLVSYAQLLQLHPSPLCHLLKDNLRNSKQDAEDRRNQRCRLEVTSRRCEIEHKGPENEEDHKGEEPAFAPFKLEEQELVFHCIGFVVEKNRRT